MRLGDTGVVSSPTDLANFLACHAKTALDRDVAYGRRTRPSDDDPVTAVLRERGAAHERAFVGALRARGLTVVDLSAAEGAPRQAPADAVSATVAAMTSGADVIVQAPLAMEGWFGYADVLRRVDGASGVGDWHYEAVDTKLASETRGGTVLQLCVYSEMLAGLQGRAPTHFHVVTPAREERYRYDDFAAFYRLVKSQYAAFAAEERSPYPEPVDHCDVCRWSRLCAARRRRDDHLSFVAGLGHSQQADLEPRGIGTLASLARLPLPLPFKPNRGARETYERLREQARLQLEQRQTLLPVFEMLAVEPGRGLSRLPAPSPGDLFFDLEGDPFVRPTPDVAAAAEDALRAQVGGGREYLFGLGRVGSDGSFTYRSWWAVNDAEERAAFEAVVDEMRRSIEADPGAHVYHYAPYEPAALKRLMGRYATRGTEIDALLRGGRFVDLYAAVRESLRAGVESYSIKQLEPLYGFVRDIDLSHAGDERRIVELALETGDDAAIVPAVREAVAAYNRDDCRSAAALRQWLEEQRRILEAAGTPVPRFVSEPGEGTENVREREARIETTRSRLLAHAAAAADRARLDEARAWRFLAFLIDWHAREDKVAWWEYFRLSDLTDEALLDEPAAISGLMWLEKVNDVIGKNGRPTGSAVMRYRYPPQEVEVRAGDTLHGRGGARFGEVEAIDRVARVLDVKRGKKGQDEHPTAAFAFDRADPGAVADAMVRLGERLADCGFEGARAEVTPDSAASDLLLRRPPRVGDGWLADVSSSPEESVAAFAARVVTRLRGTVLPIQGPPGAGKTYTGARMICELLRAGKRVGVTATGHKVIQNLIEAVGIAADELHLPVRLARKANDDGGAAGVAVFDDNGEAHHALTSGAVDVLGGTSWLWARPEFAGTVDVLFVDEAGQMSLANVLAVSHAADSLVLLGDPQQLEQPQKGSHPEGVGVSALQHVLGTHETISADRGLFLPETWRMAPAISAFTSEVFYEGKLRSRPGLERQEVSGSVRFSGSGLRLVTVAHDGRRNASDEEVDAVSGIVDELLGPDVSVTWADGRVAPLQASNILVVAPYNAHVTRLIERLAGRGVAVGTVDKFQGQEAPVVIYTMATSRPEDAPRGMEFLYSRNRLNVATSRARALCILVASERLFEPSCRTPRQMHLANALCRYREMIP